MDKLTTTFKKSPTAVETHLFGGRVFKILLCERGIYLPLAEVETICDLVRLNRTNLRFLRDRRVFKGYREVKRGTPDDFIPNEVWRTYFPGARKLRLLTLSAFYRLARKLSYMLRVRDLGEHVRHKLHDRLRTRYEHEFARKLFTPVRPIRDGHVRFSSFEGRPFREVMLNGVWHFVGVDACRCLGYHEHPEFAGTFPGADTVLASGSVVVRARDYPDLWSCIGAEVVGGRLRVFPPTALAELLRHSRLRDQSRRFRAWLQIRDRPDPPEQPDQTDVDAVVHADGDLWVASHDVARLFGTPHEAVLRAVREVACTDLFRRRNFREVRAGGLTPYIGMTPYGFMYATMGFTGEKAARVRRLFLDTFDWLDPELQYQLRR